MIAPAPLGIVVDPISPPITAMLGDISWMAEIPGVDGGVKEAPQTELDAEAPSSLPGWSSLLTMQEEGASLRPFSLWEWL
jgi:hypothetical protein